MAKGISKVNHSKLSAPRDEGVSSSCVVVTYSVSPTLEEAIATLTRNGASVHYIIEESGKQHQFYNEDDKAFFAGKSSWRGEPGVNGYGIGIMLVQDLRDVGDKNASTSPLEDFRDHFKEFPEIQIDQLVALLRDIRERCPDINLKTDLVGLGEVAQKHIAPGPKFPWKVLAEEGFGRFVNYEDKSLDPLKMEEKKEEVKALQQKLQEHGYAIEVTGKLDDNTLGWIYKFNMHYVQEMHPPNQWSEASEFVLNELGKAELHYTE